MHLYAERGSPKFEPAAARPWLIRYLSEGTPGVHDVATVAAKLASLNDDEDRAKLGLRDREDA